MRIVFLNITRTKSVSFGAYRGIRKASIDGTVAYVSLGGNQAAVLGQSLRARMHCSWNGRVSRASPRAVINYIANHLTITVPPGQLMTKAHQVNFRLCRVPRRPRYLL